MRDLDKSSVYCHTNRCYTLHDAIFLWCNYSLVAGFGPGTVAALGAVGRIEAFAMILISAVQMALVPFFGQN